MYRVKELDDFAERKAKLGKGRKGGGGSVESQEEEKGKRKGQKGSKPEGA